MNETTAASPEFLVISKGYAGIERRVKDKRKNPEIVKFHRPTAFWTAGIILILASVLSWTFLSWTGSGTAYIKTGKATAPHGAVAGDLLAVVHGLSGVCPHPDGGRVIAEYRKRGGITWRGLKNISARPANFEPGGALSTIRIPKEARPGSYVGKITVWCFGQPDAVTTTFNFSILAAVNG